MSARFCHRSEMEAFKKWLQKEGWTIENGKGEWEVFRAVKADYETPIVMYKNKHNEYTIVEKDRMFVNMFYKSQEYHNARSNIEQMEKRKIVSSKSRH